MIRPLTTVVLLAVALSVAGCASAADRYELKRVPMGPRPDQYVLVPVDRGDDAAKPYTLTGQAESRRERQPSRPVPSHPKGTHDRF